MELVTAWIPRGKTIAVAGATSAPTGAQTTADVPGLGTNYRVHNAGSVTAFVSFGTTAAGAQTNCVVPTGTGTNAKRSYPIPAGAVEIITGPFDAYWSAITASSTATIYITPGDGI